MASTVNPGKGGKGGNKKRGGGGGGDRISDEMQQALIDVSEGARLDALRAAFGIESASLIAKEKEKEKDGNIYDWKARQRLSKPDDETLYDRFIASNSRMERFSEIPLRDVNGYANKIINNKKTGNPIIDKMSPLTRIELMRDIYAEKAMKNVNKKDIEKLENLGLNKILSSKEGRDRMIKIISTI